MFPAKYQGGIFSAQHGSWNRTKPVGARVMFTQLKEDGTADKTEPFAEGWNDNGEYLGRPVDVAQLPTARSWSRTISPARSIASGTTGSDAAAAPSLSSPLPATREKVPSEVRRGRGRCI